MQTDFLAAIKQIAAERNMDLEQVLEGVKKGIVMGFRSDYPEEEGAALEVEIDPDNGSIAVYADKKVVESVSHPPTQISLNDAHKIESKLKVGDHILVEITHTGDFGRVAAQAARQVMVQSLRESEREAVIQQFEQKLGEIESAIVQRVDKDRNVFVEIQRAVAKMPPEEQINGEFYKLGSRIKVLVKRIHKDAKGKIPIVSRGDADFLKALFAMEIPEIASGTVEIMAVSRESGSRSKVAVRSLSDGVDPIGACVGQRGARINAITNELKTTRGEEKIDIIPWDEDQAKFIGYSIRPAEALEVKIINADEKQALIIVDDEHLSLAIGREGQNVRLAAKLTGWSLDIQGTQMYADNGRLSKFEQDAGVKPASKAKTKNEDKREDQNEEASEEKSENAFAGLELTSRTISALQKAGINNVEELKTQIESGEKIAGVSAKTLEEIKSQLE